MRANEHTATENGKNIYINGQWHAKTTNGTNDRNHPELAACCLFRLLFEIVVHVQSVVAIFAVQMRLYHFVLHNV